MKGNANIYLCVLKAIKYEINGLVQERHNSIANALELRLSCNNPSKWVWHIIRKTVNDPMLYFPNDMQKVIGCPVKVIYASLLSMPSVCVFRTHSIGDLHHKSTQCAAANQVAWVPGEQLLQGQVEADRGIKGHQGNIMGSIFYLWLIKVLAKERRRYICNVSSHWLKPCTELSYIPCISEIYCNLFTHH